MATASPWQPVHAEHSTVGSFKGQPAVDSGMPANGSLPVQLQHSVLSE